MNIKKLLKQTIVYWAPDTLDGYGNTTYATGVELKGRWEEKAELFLNVNGEREVSKATVYLSGDESVVMDGRMYLGELVDLSSSPDPTTEGGLRIASIGNSPSLKGETGLMKVMLK